MRKERAIQKANELSKKEGTEFIVVHDPIDDEAIGYGYFVYDTYSYPEYIKDSEIIYSSWE